MALDKSQEKQLEKQLAQHRHGDYLIDIALTDNEILKDFSVHSKVLRPEKMTAITLARWLFFNNGLYKKSSVLDMGAGTGIQGVVCGIYGAEKVIFSDLSPAAYGNVADNICRFKLGEKSENHLGDLFEKIKGRFELIIFNHPFFSDQTIEELLVAKSMKARGRLIHRFFEDSTEYLTEEGKIIMPYYHLAGSINDPAIQAPKHKLKVLEAFSLDQKFTLQKGKISIYFISR